MRSPADAGFKDPPSSAALALPAWPFHFLLLLETHIYHTRVCVLTHMHVCSYNTCVWSHTYAQTQVWLVSLVWASCLLAKGEGPQDKQPKPPRRVRPPAGSLHCISQRTLGPRAQTCRGGCPETWEVRVPGNSESGAWHRASAQHWQSRCYGNGWANFGVAQRSQV